MPWNPTPGKHLSTERLPAPCRGAPGWSVELVDPGDLAVQYGDKKRLALPAVLPALALLGAEGVLDGLLADRGAGQLGQLAGAVADDQQAVAKGAGIGAGISWPWPLPTGR